jgi:hypothetical protein
VITLQVILVLVLGFGAGVLYYSYAFVTGMVHDQLVAQKIYFPPSSEIKPGGALDPAKFSSTVRGYAGQQVDNGPKAQAYANDFIGVHLSEVANGQTYSQVSAASLADPTNVRLAAQANTLFKGETLRGLLLNAYGWWEVGLVALLAAIVLTVAGIVVLGTLIYELVVAPRPAAESKSQPLPA